MNAHSVKPALDRSHGLLGLWDMINYHLEEFTSAEAILEQEILLSHRHLIEDSQKVTAIPAPPSVLSDSDKDRLTKNLTYVHRQCRKLSMASAENRLQRIWSLLQALSPISYHEILRQLNTLREAIDDDAKLVRFYCYEPSKSTLLLSVGNDWRPTISSYPSTKGDIEEAVDAYASGHPIASIFHLMRIAEIGLRSLARERQVKFASKPIEWAQWQSLLDEIGKSVNRQWGLKTAGPEKDAALSFYSGAQSHFAGFKDKYRNQIMHVRKDYRESEAHTALNHVREFMNGLSLKIGEKTRRPIRKWP